MRMEAFSRLGYEVLGLDSSKSWESINKYQRLFEQKFQIGPTIDSINSDLINSVLNFKPGLIWLEKQLYLLPETIQKIANMGVKMVHFTPDPLFTNNVYCNDNVRRCLSIYDYSITSKKYELDDYYRNCNKVIYMPLGFDPVVHRPSLTNLPLYQSDISFIGTWEPRRQLFLQEVVKQGFNLKIWGHAWKDFQNKSWSISKYRRCKNIAGNAPFSLSKDELLAGSIQGGQILGQNYCNAVSGAKINIGFLRASWPDQHTTRTFEIPACGSMLLADRTEEHQEFFKEGIEAEYFSTLEEFIDKCKFYLSNEEARLRIANSGYMRAQKMDYAYDNRLKLILNKIELGGPQ